MTIYPIPVIRYIREATWALGSADRMAAAAIGLMEEARKAARNELRTFIAQPFFIDIDVELCGEHCGEQSVGMSYSLSIGMPGASRIIINDGFHDADESALLEYLLGHADDPLARAFDESGRPAPWMRDDYEQRRYKLCQAAFVYAHLETRCRMLNHRPCNRVRLEVSP